MSKLFVPSSSKLLSMIAAAEDAFDRNRAQVIAEREAREEARAVKAWDNEAKARFYARIQHGG